LAFGFGNVASKENPFFPVAARYDVGSMSKVHPAPQVPGNTDAERMSNALSMVLTVSKKDLLKKEARLKRESEKKRSALRKT
jgi:hypothetical protein